MKKTVIIPAGDGWQVAEFRPGAGKLKEHFQFFSVIAWKLVEPEDGIGFQVEPIVSDGACMLSSYATKDPNNGEYIFPYMAQFAGEKDALEYARQLYGEAQERKKAKRK